MPSPLYTDRETGGQPRTRTEIEDRAWLGLRTLIAARLNDESFGFAFPDQCPDGRGPCGCHAGEFNRMLAALVPDMEDWRRREEAPPTGAVLDALEFCAECVGEPVQTDYHSFYGHHHLAWDREPGLALRGRSQPPAVAQRARLPSHRGGRGRARRVRTRT